MTQLSRFGDTRYTGMFPCGLVFSAGPAFSNGDKKFRGKTKEMFQGKLSQLCDALTEMRTPEPGRNSTQESHFRGAANAFNRDAGSSSDCLIRATA
jgi:hypothetical protein